MTLFWVTCRGMRSWRRKGGLFGKVLWDIYIYLFQYDGIYLGLRTIVYSGVDIDNNNICSSTFV